MQGHRVQLGPLRAVDPTRRHLHDENAARRLGEVEAIYFEIGLVICYDLANWMNVESDAVLCAQLDEEAIVSKEAEAFGAAPTGSWSILGLGGGQ